MTGHFYSPAMLLVSEIFWKSLPPAQQQALAEAGAEARDYERKLSIDSEADYQQKLIEAGMQITEPDKAEFIAAVKPVYAKAAKSIGGGDATKGQALIDRTLAELGR